MRIDLRSGLAAALCALLGACGFAGNAPLFTAQGQVTDAQGHAIPGAVVSDGTVGALTGDDGRYVLPVYRPDLTVRKPSFADAHASANSGAAVAVILQPVSAPLRAGIDTRSGGARYTGLKGYLNASGVSTQDYPAKPLASFDVLFLAAPGALAPAELAQLQAWVHAGGRLVLCGEWGGYPAQSLDTLNALAADAGITFTGATVRSGATGTSEDTWFRIANLAPASLASSLTAQPICLYTCTSLVVTGGAMPMLESDRASYAVLARGTGPQVLAAVGASALGKVFAFADASLWSDDASEASGTPDWMQGANKQLAVALTRW